MGRPRKESVEMKETKALSSIDFSILDKAIDEIRKQTGDDTVVDIATMKSIKRLKCKSPMLGWIFGCGGTPLGRIIEIYGVESSGKSLLAQNIGADFQRQGKFVVYVDSEYSFSSDYAKIQGMSTNEDLFRLFQPNCAEDAFTVIEKLAASGQVGLIILDSLAALVPKAELEGEMTDQQMALQARVIGKGLRKITAFLGKNGTTLILINQIREKIGGYGDPTVTPGGNAPKFYSSIRIQTLKPEKNEGDEGEDVQGIKTRLKNVKNKTSIPYRRGDIYFSFKDGIDIYNEYVDFAIQYGIIAKGGAWYTFKEQRFQGIKNLILFFKEDPQTFESLASEVDELLASDLRGPKDVEVVQESLSTEGSSLAEEALKD